MNSVIGINHKWRFAEIEVLLEFGSAFLEKGDYNKIKRTIILIDFDTI